MSAAITAAILKIAKPLAKKLGLKAWRWSYENAVDRTAARNDRLRDVRPDDNLDDGNPETGVEK